MWSNLPDVAYQICGNKYSTFELFELVYGLVALRLINIAGNEYRWPVTFIERVTQVFGSVMNFIEFEPVSMKSCHVDCRCLP
jgi:hypothetical protein